MSLRCEFVGSSRVRAPTAVGSESESAKDASTQESVQHGEIHTSSSDAATAHRPPALADVCSTIGTQVAASSNPVAGCAFHKGSIVSEEACQNEQTQNMERTPRTQVFYDDQNPSVLRPNHLHGENTNCMAYQSGCFPQHVTPETSFWVQNNFPSNDVNIESSPECDGKGHTCISTPRVQHFGRPGVRDPSIDTLWSLSEDLQQVSNIPSAIGTTERMNLPQRGLLTETHVHGDLKRKVEKGPHKSHSQLNASIYDVLWNAGDACDVGGKESPVPVKRIALATSSSPLTYTRHSALVKANAHNPSPDANEPFSYLNPAFSPPTPERSSRSESRCRETQSRSLSPLCPVSADEIMHEFKRAPGGRGPSAYDLIQISRCLSTPPRDDLMQQTNGGVVLRQQPSSDFANAQSDSIAKGNDVCSADSTSVAPSVEADRASAMSDPVDKLASSCHTIWPGDQNNVDVAYDDTKIVPMPRTNQYRAADAGACPRHDRNSHDNVVLVQDQMMANLKNTHGVYHGCDCPSNQTGFTGGGLSHQAFDNDVFRTVDGNWQVQGADGQGTLVLHAQPLLHVHHHSTKMQPRLPVLRPRNRHVSVASLSTLSAQSSFSCDSPLDILHFDNDDGFLELCVNPNDVLSPTRNNPPNLAPIGSTPSKDSLTKDTQGHGQHFTFPSVTFPGDTQSSAYESTANPNVGNSEPEPMDRGPIPQSGSTPPSSSSAVGTQGSCVDFAKTLPCLSLTLVTALPYDSMNNECVGTPKLCDSIKVTCCRVDYH